MLLLLDRTVWMAARIAGVIGVTGCQFSPSGLGGPGQDAGPGGGPDGAFADAADASAGPERHVLLSEVKTAPPELEFIEIFNPSCQAVDLRDYYLTDEPTYGLLPAWGASPPDLGQDDAIVRFPTDAIIGPRSVVVVARDGMAFESGFSRPADYAVTAPGNAIAMEIVASGTSLDMELHGDGEPVTIFRWDGARDVVSDVDVLVAGDAPYPEHRLVAKQVIAAGGIDGPDEDARETPYRIDATAMQPAISRDSGTGPTAGAYQRIMLEDGFEPFEDGNGVTGHDETSEDARSTWEQDVGTIPTPGVVPPDLLAEPCGDSS